MPLYASNCWALAGWKCVEAEAKVANAKPQSRGVLMGKAFLEGLSSLPSLTDVSKASARASGRRSPRPTYLPAWMAASSWKCLVSQLDCRGRKGGGWLPALGHGCGLEGRSSRVCFGAEKSQLKDPDQPASEPQGQVPARARGGRSVLAIPSQRALWGPGDWDQRWEY